MLPPHHWLFRAPNQTEGSWANSWVLHLGRTLLLGRIVKLTLNIWVKCSWNISPINSIVPSGICREKNNPNSASWKLIFHWHKDKVRYIWIFSRQTKVTRCLRQPKSKFYPELMSLTWGKLCLLRVLVAQGGRQVMYIVSFMLDWGRVQLDAILLFIFSFFSFS